MSILSRLLLPFVKNVRRGFATNSSSSHSLVFLRDPESAAALDDLPTGNEFGWDMFHAFSRAAKEIYYTAQGGSWDSEQGYVDHQSIGTLSSKSLVDPNIGVVGGNDNSDNTSEEIAALVRAGVVDLDAMLITGLIEKYEYEQIMEMVSDV